ncbi:ATP-dependent DNA ligase [Candidatus Bathyarchaeota archaeon]|nr:ATP-dependent DNA ligase [Candidatus Bathyarchaeota archaeon]
MLQELGATSSRREKIQRLSIFLKGLDEQEVRAAVLLMSGLASSQRDRGALEVKGRILQRVLYSTSQTTLEEPELTIVGVYDQLRRAASIFGAGSRSRKEAIISALLSHASEVEREYIVRMVLGELRVGLAEGLLLEAISKAAGVERELVRRAYTLIGDLGETARLALKERREGLMRVGVRLFEPVSPMLADTAPDLESVFRMHPERTIFEYKLDGARVQIHRQGEHVEVFSRRLSRITPSLPDIVDLVLRSLHVQEAIVEGEVVAVDEAGRPMPFQELMRRFRRTGDVQEAIRRVPVRLFLFDILYLSGKVVLDLPLSERRRILEEVCAKELLAPMLLTDKLSEAEEFFDRSIREGHEGLVAKAPDARYTPGWRGKGWLKVKKAETLDVVIVAADRGSGRRHRWLSNYHLAVRDSETGDLLEVGKTFKGLTDEEFEYMTARLQSLKIMDDGYTVKVKPEIVLEVAYDEVQMSPHYRSGYALRFARIKRIREDKSAGEIDTVEKVKELYEAIFRRKARPRCSDRRV